MAGPALVVRVAANLEELKKNLKEGKDQIEVTSAAMTRLSNSFNGEKLIQSAHAVTGAIQKVGVATLSTAEGGRSLDLLDKAMDKLLRTGQQVPLEMSKTAAELRRMARATEEADKTVLTLTGNYRQFDGILKSMGINIGPYVKGLEQLTALATGGAGAMGLLAGAASVVAVAIGSWQFGRQIGETTGLTDAIARGWSVFLKYGDAAQETALATADANDASLKYAANVKRQTEVIAEDTKAAKDHSDEIKRNWLVTEGNAEAFRQLQTQLDAATKKRKDDAVAAFQAAQAQSIFGQETEKATEQVKAQTAALDERTESLKRTQSEAEAAKKKTDDFMNAATLNDRESAVSSSQLPSLTGFALDDVINRFKQAGEKDPKNALQRALAQLESQEGRVKATDNNSFFALQRDQVLLAQLRMLKGSGQIPGFASGVRNFSGGPAWVGERGPELVNLPAGSSVTPNHQLGGTTLNLTLNLNGAVVGTVRELTQQVSAELMRVMRGQGFRAPAGA